MEFPDTHVGCTLNPARSITRVSLSKNLTVTSLSLLVEGVVPLKGQRLKDLEHFLAVMRARYPSVRPDSEEALRHVLHDACEQLHLEHSNTLLETPASNGPGENSV